MNTDFRVSTSFSSHRKTVKLIRRLGKSAVASLIFLWAETAKTRPDGSLAGWDEEDIAIVSQWDGDIDEFISAMVEIGFLDQTESGYSVHEWEMHNGYASHASKRSEIAKANAEKRWQKRAKKAGITTAMQRQCNGNATVMQTSCEGNAPSPTPTPSPTPSQNPKKVPYSEDFETFWQAYPRKVEKTAAYKAWKARIKSGATPEKIIEAATRYSEHCREKITDPTFIKHPATFLSPDWEEWLTSKASSLVPDNYIAKVEPC